jgi:hypothetical protein
VYCSFFVFSFLIFPPPLPLFFSPAVGEKILRQKVFFFFGFKMFFTHRANIKNQKDIVTEKEDEYKPGKLFLSYLPGVCNYLLFTGRRLIHYSLTATHSISE